MAALPLRADTGPANTLAEAAGRGDRYPGMHHGPTSIWPDFMAGQSEEPVRVLLVDDEVIGSHRCRQVGRVALGVGERHRDRRTGR